jgi:hypothetical protein
MKHLILMFSILLFSLYGLQDLHTNPSNTNTPHISLVQLAQNILQQLPHTSLELCDNSFDYFPGSGPQQFACHMLSIIPFKQFKNVDTPNILTSGPHNIQKSLFNFQHPSDFAHYNPQFLKWVHTQMIPTLVDMTNVKQYQASYKQYIQPFLSTLYVTGQKLRAETQCTIHEIKRYRKYIRFMKSGEKIEQTPDLIDMPYERYFYFMNPLFCTHPEKGFRFFSSRGFDAGYDGNVVKGCVSWWLRRILDGSADKIWHILKRVVTAYDSKLAQQVYQSTSQAEAQVKELLTQFQRATLKYNVKALLNTMDSKYIKTQHDQMLEGQTDQFFREFFCGSVIGGKTYKCSSPSQIIALHLDQLIPPKKPQDNWRVVYHVKIRELIDQQSNTQGETIKTIHEFSILLNFEVTQSEVNGEVRYGIVGAVG